MGGIVTRLAAKQARKQGTKSFIYTAHGFSFFIKVRRKRTGSCFYPIEKILFQE